MLDFDPRRSCYITVQLLSSADETFRWCRTLPYLGLWSPSFAPRLPCKYSSRIKRPPLASRPLADLTGPISYHSSSVACQGDCIPDECVRGVGGGGAPGVPAVTVGPVTCLPQQYSGSLSHDIGKHTRGHLRVGPHLLSGKSMCGWLKGRYGPHGLWKGSNSMDFAILTGRTAQFRFHKGFIEFFFGFFWLPFPGEESLKTALK